MVKKENSHIERENNNIKYRSKNAFISLVMGMFLGMIIGGIVFINLDNPKGPNPYGWWYPATFLSTVFGGILGFVVYNKYNKNNA
jgi:uncharacterized membrane protein (UPF0136 family)